MPTPSESRVTVSDKPSKLVQLLRKRLRQLLRVVVVLAACVAVAATALAIWWVNSLNGLPDIGDPFDVAAFRAFRVPDDQNAFAFLRRGTKSSLPSGGVRGHTRAIRSSPARSRNRSCGSGPGRTARRSRCLCRRPTEPTRRTRPESPQPAWMWAAWTIWYFSRDAGDRRAATRRAPGTVIALLRMITHSRRRGSTDQRYTARSASIGLRRRLTDWATDPRTTTRQLHSALDEVLENEPNPDWDISAIKYAYLEVMREIERPIPLSVLQVTEGEWTFGLGDMALSPTMIEYLEAARRFLLREPERSRRVLRQLTAQYLAHLETRELPPRKPAVWARLPYLISTNPVTKGKVRVPLYPVSPQAPAGARALPPRAVAGWLVATLNARVWLAGGIHSDTWPWPPDRAGASRFGADRKAHRELVIMLATELYRRERGSLPSSDVALVGTYLKSLPDDRPPDVDDGTVPIVE